MYQAADSGVREAILSAMRGVIKHAGKSIGPAVRIRIFDLIKELMHNDDDQVRIFATSMLGVLSQVGGSYMPTELFVFSYVIIVLCFDEAQASCYCIFAVVM